VELDAHGQDEGIRAFSVYPAGVRTPLQRHLSYEEMRELGWYDEQGKLAPLFKTPEQGEAWAATPPQLAGRGGVYIERGDIAEIAEGAVTGLRASGRRDRPSMASTPNPAARTSRPPAACS
jgi:NAD(P)-dependent dehydrogenase (short-subunit alcohol dehydrogenase family)